MPARAREFTISGLDANGHRRLDDTDSYPGALCFKASMERIGWRDIKVYDADLREIRPDSFETERLR